MDYLAMDDTKYIFTCNMCSKKHPCVIISETDELPVACPFVYHEDFYYTDDECFKWERVD